MSNSFIKVISNYRSAQQNKIIQGSVRSKSLHLRQHSYYALGSENNTTYQKFLKNGLRKMWRNREEIQKRWDERCTRNRIKNAVLDCGCEKVEKKM